MKAESGGGIVLKFTDLSRRYGAHWALQGAEGEFRPGEIVAVQGENGSGKSTLLLTLAGILRPHRGRAEFLNDARAHLVAHYPMAYTGLSILRNLELAVAIDGRSILHIEEVMAYWQIEILKNKTLATLSRGQMQRFLLARAMLARQKILLLDEPFTGLDTAAEERLIGFIESEAKRGAVVLFSEHDSKRANAVAQRSIRMVNGRCEA
jgi:ABC-type multidrug transport system ATPase subunit